MPADRARRAIPLAVAWVAAAVIAVAVASWGVALVGRSVTEERPAALASAEVEERLAEVASTAPGSSTSTTLPPTEETATTEVGSDGTVPATSAPGPAPTTTVPPATTAPPPTAAPAGETRTYTLVGGTASLRFTPSGVTVVFANPAQGFDVEIEPEHGNGVKIEFENDAHESRLDGWWDGGPQDRIEERPDGE